MSKAKEAEDTAAQTPTADVKEDIVDAEFTEVKKDAA
jgi:hypothetical protein